MATSNAATLPSAVRLTDILVVRSTKVTAATIQAAPQLSVVIRAGAGVDTIDLEAASARGIYVANCPGRNTAAVAELAIGLLVAADRRLADATAALRNGAWRKKEFGKARGLAGRTLGILGFGAIGKAVAQRAAGLEMKVVAWSRSLTPEGRRGPGRRLCGLARGTGGRVRCRQHPFGPDARNEAHRGPAVPRGPPPRRDPH